MTADRPEGARREMRERGDRTGLLLIGAVALLAGLLAEVAAVPGGGFVLAIEAGMLFGLAVGARQ